MRTLKGVHQQSEDEECHRFLTHLRYGYLDLAKDIPLRRCHALEERRCNGENHPTQCYPGGESPRLESEVLRKLLNDAVPAQMDLKVGDAKSSWEMRALVVSSASPSRERWHRLTPD